LANQLTRFNQLLAEGARLKTDLGPSHPDLKLIEKQIQNLRQTIIDNIKAIKNDIQIASNSSRGRKTMLEGRLRSLPKRERELVEIERQKIIKENLYLYLLQKREESAISLAVTVANGKVVEPASIPSVPISPKTLQIWLIALFMGLAIPSGFALLLNNLNDKVLFREDIEKVTEVPLVSMLSYNQNGKNLVIKENSRSISAEMFRLLRTNLSFIAPGEHLETLLITSSMSGEGKSFIALNLGMTFALSGKKVLILELDLRKPKQEKYMGIKKSQKGLVNYLINPETSSKEIIKKSGLHPHLDVITRGPKPPNPGELILSPHLKRLINLLKEKYDLIILDTPPVGLVADAFQLKETAQASLYVVRSGVTRIGQLAIIDDIAKHQKLPKPFIVLNAVHLGSVKNYGYNYGYGYGYGYEKGYGNGKGYFDEDKKGGTIRKIFNQLRSRFFKGKPKQKDTTPSNSKQKHRLPRKSVPEKPSRRPHDLEV
jgi:tyrosine-protein kinase Etk/Wzc